MNLSIKLTLENEKVFFGPGTYTLLRFVKEAGSLLTASQMMGLSYSKARKMIKNYKEQTGFDAIISKVGGENGGSAILTDHAIDFMEKYEKLVNQSEDIIQQLYRKIYEES